MTLPPQSDPPMLDEIILALQPEAGATENAPVLELAAADVMIDRGSELVDLTILLGHGDELGEDLARTLTELVSVDSGALDAASSMETTGSGGHSGVESILYTALSLSGDVCTSN